MSDFVTITGNLNEFGYSLLKHRKKFCDAEIVVGMERIAVHKHILVSSSAYFEKIFSDNESMAEVTLENMDLETVQLLLDYFYTRIIRISEKNLQKTMVSANFLKLTPIVEGCENALVEKMNSSNCISTWKLAQNKSEDFEILRNIAFEYARQNFEKVTQSTEFLNLSYSEIEKLLGSDIIVANETIVFKSVRNWINRNKQLKTEDLDLDELWHYLKFEYLPKNILTSELRLFCYNNSSSVCLNKIVKAVQWKDENKLMPCDENMRDSYDINTLLTVTWLSVPMDSWTTKIFDLRNKRWIEIDSIRTDRFGFQPLLLGYKLMLIGGYRSYDSYDENTVKNYDLITHKMEALPNMPNGRVGLSVVEFKCRVYAIGGYHEFGLRRSVNYLEMYDPISKTWKQLAPMSMQRNGCKAAVLGEEIYVVGGSIEKFYYDGKIFHYDGENYLSDVESYNPVTDKWTKRTSMNEKRAFPGVAVVGKYLYVAGGKSTDDVFLMTAERYDPTIDKWIIIQQLRIPRYCMGAANFFGKFVIIGGRTNNNKTLLSMELYDDDNNKWISMPPLYKSQDYVSTFELPWQLARAILTIKDLK